MRANATSSVPELRKPSDEGPNPRQRRAPPRGGNRGNRGGRGGGRGGNGRGPPRKNPTSTSQDAADPAPKLVVDPPTATNTPAEPSSAPKPDPRPKPLRRHSTTVSEDLASVSSQTNARPPNKRKRSQQGKPSTASSNTPGKLLNVQTSGRKASTGPSSPNPAKDLPPHLATANSTATTTELKSDIDALVERVRAVAMDRPHTPGSHIDWADDDDSLPDLNDWGVTAPAQPEEPPASIPPILEDAPLQPVIPEVKIEGEPSPDETKPQVTKLEPIPDPMPRTHRARGIRPKRGSQSRGDSRNQQPPPALSLTDSVSQGPSLSPIQPSTAAAIPHTTKPQGQKRQNSNQGRNSRNQGQADSRDNGGSNGGGRQRGRNGAAVVSPMRDSFPAKTEPKANHTPPIQSQAPAQDQPPDIAQPAVNPSTEPDSKSLESKGEAVPDDEKKGIPAKTPRSINTNDPSPKPIAINPPLGELVPIPDDPQPTSPKNQSNKRNSYNPSHARAHTHGGRIQSDQPPHSAPTPNFPHHSPNTNSNPPRHPRSPNLRHSPGMRASDLGLAPKSAGHERHYRNHSSPSGVGGATRQPQATRPVISGVGINLVVKCLGNTPGSPKKDPPVAQPAS